MAGPLHGRKAKFPYEAENFTPAKLGDVQERIEARVNRKISFFSSATRTIGVSQSEQKKQYKKGKRSLRQAYIQEIWYYVIVPRRAIK